jgi:hypothetical protein
MELDDCLKGEKTGFSSIDERTRNVQNGKTDGPGPTFRLTP